MQPEKQVVRMNTAMRERCRICRSTKIAIGQNFTVAVDTRRSHHFALLFRLFGDSECNGDLSTTVQAPRITRSLKLLVRRKRWKGVHLEDYAWSNVSLTRPAKSSGAKGFARNVSRKSTVSIPAGERCGYPDI